MKLADLRKLIIILCFSLTVNLSFTQTGRPAFYHYKIDLKADKVDFFELVEAIEIIRLEETETSLISNAENYAKHPDGFVIADNKSHTIHVFNHDGDLVNSFNKNGWGPEEYQHLDVPWVRDGHIELFDWATRKFLKYTIKGELVESKTLGFPYRLVHAHPYRNGYLISRVSASTKDQDTISGPSVLFFDDQLQIKKGVFPYGKLNPDPIGYGGYYMYEDNELLVKKKGFDSLFRVVDYEMVPYMKFDFGKEWTWSDPKTMANWETAAEAVFNGKKVSEIIVEVGDELIDVSYFTGLMRNAPRGFVNRKTGRFYRYDLRMNRKERFDLTPIEWQGDLLLHHLSSYQLEQFVERLEDKPVKIRGGHSIREIMESENPVLVYVKFNPL